MIPILSVEHRWGCPSCGALDVTTRTEPHTQFHHCPAVGITAPMVEFTGNELDLSSVRHRLVDREDYVGDEIVRTDDNGRPWMAIATDRADGSNDCAVFAPTAHVAV